MIREIITGKPIFVKNFLFTLVCSISLMSGMGAKRQAKRKINGGNLFSKYPVKKNFRFTKEIIVPNNSKSTIDPNRRARKLLGKMSPRYHMTNMARSPTIPKIRG